MAHIFDTSSKDPYAESAHQVERNAFPDPSGLAAGSDDQAFDVLSNAIVTALGDIAAAAYRYGVNQPEQMKGLAQAVAAASDTVFAAYRGEVDPEGALQALEDEDRAKNLAPVNRDKLKREINKTRQLEHLVLNARRLPDLLDFAGSLDLIVPEDVLEQGEILLSADHTPTATTLP